MNKFIRILKEEILNDLSDFTPITGHEGRYLINKKGEVYSKNSKMLLKPVYSKKRGSYSPYVALYMGRGPDGKKKHYSVSIARLIAITYLPYGDKGSEYVVRLKNGDGRDLNPNNVIWMTRKESMDYDIKNTSDDESGYKGRVSDRPINRYSIDGKYLDSFTSAKRAESKTGIFNTNINKAASSGEYGYAMGYLWKFESDEYPKGIDIEAKPTRVNKYSLDGKYLDSYDTTSEAANKSGVMVGNIGKVAKGKAKSAGGFLWKYESDEYLRGKDIKPKATKSVNKYSLDGKYLDNYVQSAEAARKNGMSGTGNMSRVLGGFAKSAGGFKWKFESDKHPKGVDLTL